MTLLNCKPHNNEACYNKVELLCKFVNMCQRSLFSSPELKAHKVSL